MPILGLLKRLVAPIFGVVDKAVKDKDLASRLKHDIEMQLAEHLEKELEAKRDIIVAEAQAESWLTRSWRPITMLAFLVLLFTYWWGLAPDYVVANPSVVTEVFSMLKIGIGGYIVSRGGEKVAAEYRKSKIGA